MSALWLALRKGIGYLGMRANVDDFDEGLEIFKAWGYSLFGTKHETGSSITGLLSRGKGTYVVLFQHKG